MAVCPPLAGAGGGITPKKSTSLRDISNMKNKHDNVEAIPASTKMICRELAVDTQYWHKNTTPHPHPAFLRHSGDERSY